MIERDFYTYHEVVTRFGLDPEAIRQSILRGSLLAYLELRSESARYVNWLGCSDAPPSATGRFCKWSRTKRTADDKTSGFDEYVLSGWFRITPNSLSEAALRGYFTESPEVWPSEVGADNPTGDDEDYFEVDWTREGDDPGRDFYRPTIKDFWFRATDIDGLRHPTIAAEPPQSKELKTRERDTLLQIIAVLCELSGANLQPEAGHFEIAGDLLPEMIRRKATMSRQTLANKIQEGRQLIRPVGPGRKVD